MKLTFINALLEEELRALGAMKPNCRYFNTLSNGESCPTLPCTVPVLRRLLHCNWVAKGNSYTYSLTQAGVKMAEFARQLLALEDKKAA